MPSCTCSSPDGSQSQTYYFDEMVSSCENLCRLWDDNSSISRRFPYGSAERAEQGKSCKMFITECGSGPAWIQLSEPRTECVVGDRYSVQMELDQGHGMVQNVTIQLKVIGDGETLTINEPDSPFNGLEVKTCAVNGFDDYVYWQTKNSSTANPIVTTPWGQELDLSTGPNVNQGSIPVYAFRNYHTGYYEDRRFILALNPFYSDDAVCSVEEWFEQTGQNWTTLPESYFGLQGCEAKLVYVANQLDIANSMQKSIEDYRLACRFENGEFLTEKDWGQIYKAGLSEDLMTDNVQELREECDAEGNPHDEDMREARYAVTNSVQYNKAASDANPFGHVWWAIARSYPQLVSDNDAYMEWLQNYLVEEQGIEAFEAMSPEEVLQYQNTYTYNNWLTSPEGEAFWNEKKDNEACVLTKLEQETPEFDWRGAFNPTFGNGILIPESLIGSYSWFDSTDAEYGGQIPAQTFSPTSNESGYEVVDVPEGIVKIKMVAVPPQAMEEVKALRGVIEVDPEVNEMRESLTTDFTAPEGVFLPDDDSVMRIGADDDLISSMEQGQLSDEDLYNLFTADSAEEVAAMFDDLDIDTTEEDEQAEAEQDQEEQEEQEEDVAEEDEVQEQQVEEEEVVVDQPLPTSEATYYVEDIQKSNPTPTEKSLLEKPAFIAVAGAVLAGTIAYLIIQRQK